VVHRHRGAGILAAALLGAVLLGSGAAGASSPAGSIAVSAQRGTTAALPGEFVIEDFVVFVDDDGTLWFKLHPATPWGATPPSEWFSDYMQVTVGDQTGGVLPTLFGFQTHDGVSDTYSFFGPTQGPPVEGYLMDDGALLFNSGLTYGGGTLAVNLNSGYLPTEGGQFENNTSEHVVDAADIPTSSDPTHFDDEFPVYDLTTGETVEPPVVATTTTTTGPESTTTTQPGTTTVTTYGTTTERPRFTTTGRGGTCWSCWGIVLLFVAVLLCILWTWLKTYEWWTCWLPWFLVIFIWVPFLLAGLWWWRPAWWWAPLLGWFPLIGGYTWFWARHRSWWKPWHLYLVAGYLGALVLGIRLVGAPEWGLLFPLFWVPWVAFYLGYRALRRPWWQPWLWGVAAAWVAWVFIWVIALTPWWAWWFPVAFFPLAGWWFVSQGYSWREIHGPKWCWVLPFAFLPFLTWWIPLWDPWWCFVVAFFVGATLFCSIFTHYKEEEWWTCWLPWFLVVFVWVPFLLAGLWFFRPVWWGWALVPWFLVIPGYALWWARRRSWWQLWMWYAVGGYLVAAAGAAYVVGAPEWGLLLPVFWLPWAGLYVWYRALRRPWWKPWMYLLFAAYAVWIVAWLGWLTPWWGWWFPVAFVPFLGWWFVDHGYDWALIRQKSCWVVPWCVLPWLSFMVALECVVGSGCCS